MRYRVIFFFFFFNIFLFFKCQSAWRFSVEEHRSSPVTAAGGRGGCVGVWRRWRGVPRRSCTGTRRLSLFLANLRLAPLITYLSYLLSLASLSLPQNSTHLKTTSDAIDVCHAIFFRCWTSRVLSERNITSKLGGRSRKLCWNINPVCLTLGVAPRAAAEPALRRDAPPTPPRAGGCLGGGTCHQQPSAASLRRRRATRPREMRFLTRLAASSPTARSERCPAAGSQRAASPQPTPRPPGLPVTFYYRFTGLLRAFGEQLDGASGGNTAGSHFSP